MVAALLFSGCRRACKLQSLTRESRSMNPALLKLHIKHHAFYGVILLGLWLLLDFLVRTVEAEHFTQNRCLGSQDGLSSCEVKVQTGLGVVAGAGTIPVVIVILVALFAWLTTMPNRKDAERPGATTQP